MHWIDIKLPAVDENGYLPDEYGGNGTGEFVKNGLSLLSPEIVWTPVPGAKSYALEFIDYASAAVSGMVFVHWSVLNINKPHLPKDASRNDKSLLQGVVSTTPGTWRNKELSATQKLTENLEHSVYVGPCPPNGDHWYTFRVYALSAPVKDINPPYFIGAFRDAIRGKVIGMGEKEVAYRHVKR